MNRRETTWLETRLPPTLLLLRIWLPARSSSLINWSSLLSWFMSRHSHSIIQCILNTGVSLYFYGWYFISSWNQISIYVQNEFRCSWRFYGSELITNIELLYRYAICQFSCRLKPPQRAPVNARVCELCISVRYRTPKCFE